MKKLIILCKKIIKLNQVLIETYGIQDGETLNFQTVVHSSFCLEAMEIINFIKYICVSFNITYMNNFLEYIYIFQRNTN